MAILVGHDTHQLPEPLQHWQLRQTARSHGVALPVVDIDDIRATEQVVEFFGIPEQQQLWRQHLATPPSDAETVG